MTDKATNKVGQSPTGFTATVAVDRANLALQDEVVVLTNAECDRFLAALAATASSSPQLMQAARRAMRAVKTGVLGD